MANVGYQSFKLMWSVGVAVATALGCSASDPKTAEQSSGDATVIQFRTVGTGYQCDGPGMADSGGV